MSRNYLHIIQKAVKETALKEGAKEGARAIEDLEKAGKNLGHARKAFEHAILARSQLHTNWKQFLSDAVRLWQDYAAQLTEQERKLQEQVTMTREAFQAAKQLSAKAHQVAGVCRRFTRTRNLEKCPTHLQRLQHRSRNPWKGCRSRYRIYNNRLLQLLPRRSSIRTAKRPRTRLNMSPDTTMKDAPGDSQEPGDASSPFQQAGCK